jgi:hypothetical protein
MSTLVRLYPKAWRERYEAEFRSLLEARPPTPGDRLDIVRGAIDARIHPEIPGDPSVRAPARRVPIAVGLSLLAGASWLAWTAIVLREFRGWGSGQPENTGFWIALAATALLSLAAAHVAIGLGATSNMRAIGGPAATIAALAFGVSALGGGWTVALAIGASIALALALAGLAVPRWLSSIWVVSAAMAVGSMIVFVAGNGRDVGVLVGLAPYGVCWLVIGVKLMIRGLPAPRADPA